jgi:hypothetical protein
LELERAGEDIAGWLVSGFSLADDWLMICLFLVKSVLSVMKKSDWLFLWSV